ncbi:MAG TPA: Gfo/Idh/MocA family oxidoreductase [Roseiflexaceae bacterium]|nr:Gfo/Idh/MocA family oxidoreductase [Roseiflexaceae bacterium]
MSGRIRIAQYGTRHGHAEGKLTAIRTNPHVELAGVYEPDPTRRAELAHTAGYAGIPWFDHAAQMLDDPTIVAVAAEGRNDESLDHVAQIIAAGKHVWYDKPAGENWQQWQDLAAAAQRQQLLIQMGYMFRYHAGFRRIEQLVRSGALGTIFSIRAHMSTWLPPAARAVIAVHQGGILYDLAGHMLDQIVWLLGRPQQVDGFLQTSDPASPAGFADNTLAVLRYPRAMALIDIAACEIPPPARRFEVYGSHGSVIMEPFEPAGALRLCLATHGGTSADIQSIAVEQQSRQQLYDRELAAFIATLYGEQPPDRPLAHELLVQETLLRATGTLT